MAFYHFIFHFISFLGVNSLFINTKIAAIWLIMPLSLGSFFCFGVENEGFHDKERKCLLKEYTVNILGLSKLIKL